MVTLSVTRSRVANVLNRAADLLAVEGWDPERNSMMNAIDKAAGFVPGKGSVDAEATSLAAWDALCAHLDELWPNVWEAEHTQTEVEAALRAAADEVMAS